MIRTDRCPTCGSEFASVRHTLTREADLPDGVEVEQRTWIVRCCAGHEFDVEHRTNMPGRRWGLRASV